MATPIETIVDWRAVAESLMKDAKTIEDRTAKIALMAIAKALITGVASAARAQVENEKERYG